MSCYQLDNQGALIYYRDSQVNFIRRAVRAGRNNRRKTKDCSGELLELLEWTSEGAAFKGGWAAFSGRRAINYMDRGQITNKGLLLKQANREWVDRPTKMSAPFDIDIHLCMCHLNLQLHSAFDCIILRGLTCCINVAYVGQRLKGKMIWTKSWISSVAYKRTVR